ncbi:MAG: hypothetical protein RLZZ468_603 [Cyanobacteriota bacterium]
MVPFTPSVCSERPPLASGAQGARLLAVPLLTITLLGCPAARSSAQPGWRHGVFPVASFSGYTSHFGQRNGPGGAREQHDGLDIAAPLGSPIRSWWGGTVRQVIADGSCGLGLVISSGAYEHLYCHLAGGVQDGSYRSGPVLLAAGSRVRRGQLIGHVGLSGRTTGPHLHWGLRYRGRWLNPATVLRAMAAARRSPQLTPISEARP